MGRKGKEKSREENRKGRLSIRNARPPRTWRNITSDAAGAACDVDRKKTREPDTSFTCMSMILSPINYGSTVYFLSEINRTDVERSAKSLLGDRLETNRVRYFMSSRKKRVRETVSPEDALSSFEKLCWFNGERVYRDYDYYYYYYSGSTYQVRLCILSWAHFLRQFSSLKCW